MFKLISDRKLNKLLQEARQQSLLDCQETCRQWQELAEEVVSIDKAILLDDETLIDLKKMSDYHIKMLIKTIEIVKLDILAQTTKSISEPQQIVYRNGALTALTLLANKIKDWFKGSNKKLSSLTRERIE